jgi:predicted RNA binding protein YcfA (HicA-like mRNA interferase family)
MSKQSKLLQKLYSSPPPADFKWSDLVTLLEGLGYRKLNNTGSRRKFYNSKLDDLIICHEPHPSPNVDKGCIKDVASQLREKGIK